MKALPDNGLWVSCCIFLSIFAATRSSQLSSRAQAEGEQPKLHAPAPASPHKPLLQLLSRAAGLDDTASSIAELRRATAGMHFIIATVPNPERGPLAVYTDELLDAISSSAVDAGYLLDVHRLPWRAGGTGKVQPTPDARENVETAVAAAAAAPRGDPGALVFRRARPDASDATQVEFLVILLVQESPVEGVDAADFRAAAEFAGCEDENMYVLGPSFSGSASELWKLIHELDPTGCSASVVSGSATGNLHPELLTK